MGWLFAFPILFHFNILINPFASTGQAGVAIDFKGSRYIQRTPTSDILQYHRMKKTSEILLKGSDLANYCSQPLQ